MEIAYPVLSRIESSNLSRSASALKRMNDWRPTEAEIQRRDAVMAAVFDFIRSNRTIKLPVFDPELDRPSDQYALLSVGIEDNVFGGNVADYRYQFEGEEDLLHLIVTGREGQALTPQEGQRVAGFLLPDVSPALIWLRPGEFSQHFYVGHDELTRVCAT